ncbi:metal ABC transporter substrate-binding protein [Thorsellia anophelis]|uniref:Manganese/iron transport system substrate-binding protein n=1 Tax=Thorsellia anophelis DSM 18579 TaxID=1123402 RepID=A0A1I0BPZ2_9GAMM|nr:metal ABC transporter substrate-binding protein [Thorsellia anophelis]SET09014.1 manganese/iron transport system substrate-binding protein [Thorsellia anophelis DSM 18579]
MKKLQVFAPTSLNRFSILFILFYFIPYHGFAETLPSKPFRVITTFTILQDMAQTIAGDKMVVESITKPGAEIHDYQPTPKDIAKIQHADLILYNGLNLESWFEKFYQDIRTIPAILVTDGIVPINIENSEHTNEAELIPNPHAWMSPNNALIYIENIKNAFIDLDPPNRTYYEQNALDYAEKIKQLALQIEKKLSYLEPEARWLVTSEGAFSYLAKDFDLKEAYLYPINAEQQVKPRELTELIDLIKLNQIPVVFSENTTSDRPARTIAAETNAIYGGVLFVDSLSNSEGPVPTYLKLLERTLDTIVLGFETAKEN